MNVTYINGMEGITYAMPLGSIRLSLDDNRPDQFLDGIEMFVERVRGVFQHNSRGYTVHEILVNSDDIKRFCEGVKGRQW